jgi:pantoate--beta-alanine ligase
MIKIIQTINQMVDWSNQNKFKKKIGFVPTMGYLHEGHLSLVKAAKEKTDLVVVSIYVNPTQFSPTEDLSTYPRDFERDISLLKKLNVDVVFFPSNREMYPNDFKTWIVTDEITSILCGKSRPTHFKGVTTIVSKLINIVNPDFIFMGEKDFQQLTVLKQMIKDLNFRTEIIGCPIVRETDGLAMSSRNKYLDLSERKNALCLFSSIELAKKMVKQGEKSAAKIIVKIRNSILQKSGKIDYVEILDDRNLEPVDILNQHSRLFLAVYIGKTRLIDNTGLNV